MTTRRTAPVICPCQNAPEEPPQAQRAQANGLRHRFSWRRLPSDAGPESFARRGWMAAGFAAALAGDVFLAVLGASRASAEFLAGVVCFTLAHLLWMAGQRPEARPDARVVSAVALPIVLFVGVRLAGVVPTVTHVALVAYSLVTALSVAVAVATRRRFYLAGISTLLVSDLLIGGRLLGVPGCSSLAGPLYVMAEACLVVSFVLGDREPRRGAARPERSFDACLRFGALAGTSFVLAALSWPGGGYNPFRRMLSALGRTSVRGVDWPWCHYLFLFGMVAAAFAVAAVFLPELPSFRGWRRRAASWGLAANVGGLVAIALVPENVNPFFHNVGCWGATLGGGAILLARDRAGCDRIWTVVLSVIAVAFGLVVGLHAVKALPFVPWTPTGQKTVIVAFTLWALHCAARCSVAKVRRSTWAILVALAALVALRAAVFGGVGVPFRGDGPVSAAPGPRSAASAVPLTDDERAALRWLDHVTGPLPPDEERDWWDVGGSQHGLFAKRYHIAFCGYAAAALGWRGGEAERTAAARILGRCIERYVRPDVWGYAMSKSYWGRKPWAPDPCFRENVMYTGHLLQLLALYETFSGDTRYWTKGWDFVWKDGRAVHYDVRRLIDVTVRQMRDGPTGGVTCEPGLLFFPCNNHPHIALRLFSALGHGDWSADARRWEKWALSHYPRPAFGGGALRLVYHARSGLFFPRGHNGLDGWSLLWYEPWAKDRGTALALWREAVSRIDWNALETAPDAAGTFDPCLNPADVPPVAAATFLAAAARACDDSATAARLEAISDRSLVRRDGMLWLDVGREWRVGATANRLIALAESNGLRFRSLPPALFL